MIKCNYNKFASRKECGKKAEFFYKFENAGEIHVFARCMQHEFMSEDAPEDSMIESIDLNQYLIFSMINE